MSWIRALCARGLAVNLGSLGSESRGACLQWMLAVDGEGDKTSGEGSSASRGSCLGFEFWMVKEKAHPAKPFHAAASSGQISFKNRSWCPTAPVPPRLPTTSCGTGTKPRKSCCRERPNNRNADGSSEKGLLCHGMSLKQPILCGVPFSHRSPSPGLGKLWLCPPEQELPCPHACGGERVCLWLCCCEPGNATDLATSAITTTPPAASAARVFVLSDERTRDVHMTPLICLFYEYTPLSSSLPLSFPETILTPIPIKENIKITFSIIP